MGWTAHRTQRNTLHVINDEDGSHFEAADEEEAQANIDAVAAAAEAEKQAAVEAQKNANELTSVVTDTPTLRSN